MSSVYESKPWLERYADHVPKELPLPETSITRLTPRRLTSHPTSSEAPRPYFKGVASIVKMVSLPFAAMVLLSPTRFPVSALMCCLPGKYTRVYPRQKPAATRTARLTGTR